MSLSVLLVLLLYFIDIIIITIIFIITMSIPADHAFWPVKFLIIKDSNYALYKGKVNINPRQKMFFFSGIMITCPSCLN